MAEWGDLVVARDTVLRDEYLCTYIGAFNRGHGPTALPVVQIHRMLRFPIQHAIAAGWEDKPQNNPPLRYLDCARLLVLRPACLAEQVMLTFFRDYWASVRSCALDAIRETDRPAERRMIALHLTGASGRTRSTCVLSTVEKLRLREEGLLSWETRPEIQRR